MREVVFSLANEARRTGLVTALRQQRSKLTLARLDALLRDRKYGDDLARLTIQDLLESRPPTTVIHPGESIADAILRVFRAQPDAWLASGFFTRYLHVPRWTAQATLAELAERGLLLRAGKTSATRYHLAPVKAQPR